MSVTLESNKIHIVAIYCMHLHSLDIELTVIIIMIWRFAMLTVIKVVVAR